MSFVGRCLVYLEGKPKMTEFEVLVRNINGLTELLRVAWRDLANPLLTPFELREFRNQIEKYSAELGRHFSRLIEVERCRFRKQSVEEEGWQPDQTKQN